jgi:hypothetical protein
MKYIVAVLVTLVLGVAALFAVFKFTAGRKVATSPAQLPAAAPTVPPNAAVRQDRTAQRVDAIAGLVGAASGLVGKFT